MKQRLSSGRARSSSSIRAAALDPIPPICAQHKARRADARMTGAAPIPTQQIQRIDRTSKTAGRVPTRMPCQRCHRLSVPSARGARDARALVAMPPQIARGCVSLRPAPMRMRHHSIGRVRLQMCVPVWLQPCAAGSTRPTAAHMVRPCHSEAKNGLQPSQVRHAAPSGIKDHSRWQHRAHSMRFQGQGGMV